MGLIILNIGLQHGWITPILFTMMVIMTLVTTLMTSPLFNLLSSSFVRLPATRDLPAEMNP